MGFWPWFFCGPKISFSQSSTLLIDQHQEKDPWAWQHHKFRRSRERKRGQFGAWHLSEIVLFRFCHVGFGEQEYQMGKHRWMVNFWHRHMYEKMFICLKTLWDMSFFHVCGEGWFGLGGRNLQAEPLADTCLNANQIYYRRWNNFLGLMMFVWHPEFFVVFPWFLYTKSKAFVLESCCFFRWHITSRGTSPQKRSQSQRDLLLGVIPTSPTKEQL